MIHHQEPLKILPGWYAPPNLSGASYRITPRIRERRKCYEQADGSKRNNGKGQPGHKGAIAKLTCQCGQARGKHRRSCNDCRNKWQREHYRVDPAKQKMLNAKYYQLRKLKQEGAALDGCT